MTSSKVQVELWKLFVKIDLSWVDWDKIQPFVNLHSSTLGWIKSKDYKSIIQNGNTPTVRSFLIGFELKFEKLPLFIGHVNSIVEGVIKYRLMEGR